jgi:hypothetical protein
LRKINLFFFFNPVSQVANKRPLKDPNFVPPPPVCTEGKRERERRKGGDEPEPGDPGEVAP